MRQHSFQFSKVICLPRYNVEIQVLGENDDSSLLLRFSPDILVQVCSVVASLHSKSASSTKPISC